MKRVHINQKMLEKYGHTEECEGCRFSGEDAGSVAQDLKKPLRGVLSEDHQSNGRRRGRPRINQTRN